MNFDWLLKPTTELPSIYAKRLSSAISPINEIPSPSRGFLSGAVEGAGDLISGMTSPLSLATTAIGMPWLRSAAQPIRMGLNSIRGVNRSLSPIAPEGLPAELIYRGGEEAFNAAKSIYSPARKTVEDLAYEIVKRGPDPINKSIGGSFNLAEAMRRSNAARGK